MNLPILGKLKDGEQFDFTTLADNIDQTDEFWKWWWEEKVRPGQICRPEIISNDDPILSETGYKTIVNLCSFREFFDRTLFNLTEAGVFPIKDGITREAFQRLMLRVVANASVVLATRPQIIFTGGGYGSGKTTIINQLCEQNILPLRLPNLIGPDVIKQLVPEYHLIKAVADGRASLTVQKECITLASKLFLQLIEAGRSFIWDSSMSNKSETLNRIALARERNYELTMIAICTPLEVATQRAMTRARFSRRFPHPVALPESHKGFRLAFNDYVALFDEIMVIANGGSENETELIAEKTGAKGLEILNSDLFNSILRASP